jgi:hypothetical protein
MEKIATEPLTGFYVCKYIYCAALLHCTILFGTAKNLWMAAEFSLQGKL